MSSFLEKLKKGMGVNENFLKETEEEGPIKPKTARPSFEKPPEEKLEKKEEDKIKKPRKKRVKKIKEMKTTIKTENIIQETEKPKEMPLKKIKIKEEKEPLLLNAEEKETPLAKSLEAKDKEWFEPEGQLAVDVYQTENDIIIQAAIAGVRPEDLNITVENDVLTIRGKREAQFKEEKKNYFYQECYWGRFSREIILPVEVDASRTKATMKENVLTVKIPKIEREKKRKIIVEK